MTTERRNISLGIDIGTSSVKICLLDVDTQCTVFTTSEPTRATVSGLDAGKDEQDVNKIIDAVHACLMRVTDKNRADVKCIAVSGQMHGVVFWNSEAQRRLDGSRPITIRTSNLYTWQDRRATSEFLASLPEPNSHQSLSTGFGCVTLFWLARNEPELFVQERCDCAGGIMDYLVTVLCGLDRPILSDQIAHTWGYFNTQTHSWNLDILKEAGFPVTLLPIVAAPGSRAGYLQYDWCGIPVGTPVLVGLGDVQCAARSTLTSESDAVMNISTSSQLFYPVHCSNFTPLRKDNPSAITYFPYFDDQYLAVAASLNGGNVLSHLVCMLKHWFAEFDIVLPEERIWSKLTELATSSTAEHSSIQIIPTIFGERLMPDPCVTLTGSSESYLNLGAIYRSVCAGIIDNLHMMLPCILLIESGIKQLILTGSVFDKNPWIKAHVEKLYGGSLSIVTGQGADSAVGAAKVAIGYLHSR